MHIFALFVYQLRKVQHYLELTSPTAHACAFRETERPVHTAASPFRCQGAHADQLGLSCSFSGKLYHVLKIAKGF